MSLQEKRLEGRVCVNVCVGRKKEQQCVSELCFWSLRRAGQSVDGCYGGCIHILYTYSTVFVTTVFPASSETLENVLLDRKVCVPGCAQV